MQEEIQMIKIWEVIDKLAKDRNVSCSKLAENAGLNGSVFSYTRRFSHIGTNRFPSLKTIVKLLKAYNITWYEFWYESGVVKKRKYDINLEKTLENFFLFSIIQILI